MEVDCPLREEFIRRYAIGGESQGGEPRINSQSELRYTINFFLQYIERACIQVRVLWGKARRKRTRLRERRIRIREMGKKIIKECDT